MLKQGKKCYKTPHFIDKGCMCVGVCVREKESVCVSAKRYCWRVANNKLKIKFPCS